MQRQVFLVKTVLAIFVCCSVWLPVSHECFENFGAPAGLETGSTASRCASSQAGDSHEFLSDAPTRALPEAPGLCLACLWSHHLFLGKVSVGLGIPQLTPSEALPTKSTAPVVANLLDCPTMRGPPAPAPSTLDCAL